MLAIFNDREITMSNITIYVREIEQRVPQSRYCPGREKFSRMIGKWNGTCLFLLYVEQRVLV